MSWLERPIICLLCVLAAYGATNCPIRQESSTQRWVDCYDRELFFHGVNVVYKAWPWYPERNHFDAQKSLSRYDMELLQSWGLNGVRLGVMWPGVAPNETVRDNATYLSIMTEITDDLELHNISTLVDFHQDCLSPKFCGEGAPDWELQLVSGDYALPWPFASPFENINSSTGIPSPEQCANQSWGVYQATASGSSGYQQIYSNTEGAGDNFDAFWTAVARAFNASSGVIGHEIMNEPWAGDWYADPFLMVPGIADRLNLQPLYDRVQGAIRRGDSQHAILFESVTWDDFFPVGFNETPGSDPNTGLSFHYYGNVNLNASLQFESRAEDWARLRAAPLLTEFDIGNSPSGAPAGSPRGRDRRRRQSLLAGVSRRAAPQLCLAARRMAMQCGAEAGPPGGASITSSRHWGQCQEDVIAVHHASCDAAVARSLGDVPVDAVRDARAPGGDSASLRPRAHLEALASAAGVSLPSEAAIGRMVQQEMQAVRAAEVEVEVEEEEKKRLASGVAVQSPLTDIQHTLELADQHLVSWLGWEYKPLIQITGWGWGPIQPDGQVNTPEVAVLSRTFAQAVAGHLQSMSFDTKSAEFQMQFVPASPSRQHGAVEDSSPAGRTTTVYCNLDLHYPRGVRVQVSPQGALQHTVHEMPAPNANATRYALVDFVPTARWMLGRAAGESVQVTLTPA